MARKQPAGDIDEHGNVPAINPVPLDLRSLPSTPIDPPFKIKASSPSYNAANANSQPLRRWNKGKAIRKSDAAMDSIQKTMNGLGPQELRSALGILAGAGMPAMIWGPPGIGKSEVVEQVAADLGMVYKDFFAILMDPVDLHGIPYRDTEKNRTRWAPPGEFPEDDGQRYLLNLDEITAATPAVQAALYQFVLKGRIGEYQLPAGSAIVACGNRESDRGVAHTMPTPLVSRFRHFNLEVDHGQWMQWATEHDVHLDVLFFLSFRPDLLHLFDPKQKNTPFPCPRTWKFVSDLLKTFELASEPPSRSIVLASLAGTVGEAAAIELTAFLKLKAKLPHPRTILNNPMGAPVPDEPDVLLALCGALCRSCEDTNFDAVVTYAKRLRPEVGEFLVGSCVKRDTDLTYTKAYIGWAAQH